MAFSHVTSWEQQALVTTCIIAPIISSFFVAIRLWTRIYITHTVGWDDYSALATLPFCVVYSVIVALATKHGFGWYAADIPPKVMMTYFKYVFASSLNYHVALLGYKFSILLLYLRLFGISDKFRYYTWAVMFFVFGYLLSNFITQLSSCTPLVKYWNPHIPGHCIVSLKAAFAYGSMNFVSDFFIFILPLPMVWRLRLSRRQRVGVSLVFMGGAIAFLVAAVRYGLLIYKLFYAIDKTWWAGKVTLCMILEINTGLICSCTPALKPFIKDVAAPRSFRKVQKPLGIMPKDCFIDRSSEPQFEKGMLVTGEDGQQKPEVFYASQRITKDV